MTDPRLNDPITRRLFLKRAAVGASALSLPSLIAACGGGGGIAGQTNEGGGASTEVKQQLADTLVFANWPLYIDQKGKKRPTLDEFTAQTGVNVRYIEEVNDNEEWFGKYQAQLSQGQDIGRDLTVLTDWMAARMVRLGYVQKKDKSAIPNEANLVSTLQHPTWDPDRTYSLPWQSGMTGIAYNKKETNPVTSIEQLLTDPALKGKVTCLTEMPDCMGLVMQSNGDDPTKVDPAAFDKAIGTLQDAVDSGQIRRFTGNDYGDDLSSGNVAAAMAWSGDVVQLQLDNPDLEFVLPEETPAESTLEVHCTLPSGDAVEYPEFPFGEIPHGKQSWYGPLGGIWQSVRLIARDKRHVSHVAIDADIGGEVAFAFTRSAAAFGATIRAAVSKYAAPESNPDDVPVGVSAAAST